MQHHFTCQDRGRVEIRDRSRLTNIRIRFAAAFLILIAVNSAQAANIVVNSNDDSDDGQCDSTHCSLREAINCANDMPGADVITFETGPTVILPDTPLPALTDDATTIRGQGEIVLDGSNLTNAISHGLTIRSSNNKIQGLTIRNFLGHGIQMRPLPEFPHADDNVIGVDGNGQNDASEGNVIRNNGWTGFRIESMYKSLTTADRNVVAGNIIGLNKAGTEAAPNGNCGISIQVYASHNRIGTDFDGVSDVLERNIISGNGSTGVYISSMGTYNYVSGNYIGTDVTGTQPIGNDLGDGVSIYFSKYTIVQGNVIGDNGSNGVGIGSSSNTIVRGNMIGTDPSGTQDLGNHFNGIRIFSGKAAPATDNKIGFAGTFLYPELFVRDPNVIAFNDWSGIVVNTNTEGFNTSNNAILYNSIYENFLLGIDLTSIDTPASVCVDGVTLNDTDDTDGGGNGLLNFPDITSAQTHANLTYLRAAIDGGLANSSFIVQFFAVPEPDATGYGEGAIYLGETSMTTDSIGNGATGLVVLDTPTPMGYYITCTATLYDDWGPISTSEFSAAVQVNKGKISFALALTMEIIGHVSEFMEQGAIDPEFAKPLAELLDDAKSALIDYDFETALVLMEEFDWWQRKVIVANKSVPEDAIEELRKLTSFLIDELQSLQSAEDSDARGKDDDPVLNERK